MANEYQVRTTEGRLSFFGNFGRAMACFLIDPHSQKLSFNIGEGRLILYADKTWEYRTPMSVVQDYERRKDAIHSGESQEGDGGTPGSDDRGPRS